MHRCHTWQLLRLNRWHEAGKQDERLASAG